ncbi:hypothetical protein E2C01_083899 [Portunus trituberculatus]|uniref:Uncharacterized protein n=1 Tax=Portunus trituberculatus TaxID=210409 RepID=A0A5B7IYA1_PORTR|nr:hypothetical protein [Portunus trituberculatus]
MWCFRLQSDLTYDSLYYIYQSNIARGENSKVPSRAERVFGAQSAPHGRDASSNLYSARHTCFPSTGRRMTVILSEVNMDREKKLTRSCLKSTTPTNAKQNNQSSLRASEKEGTSTLVSVIV